MAYTTFEGTISLWTNAAVHFQSVYWEAPMWLPISQIIIERDGDGYYVVKLKDWLAGKKRLYEFTHYGEAEIEEIDQA